MSRREDRRDLGWLGLIVAVYGLACAPVLHAVYGHGGARSASASSTAQGWVSHVQAEAPPAAPDAPAPHDERKPHSHAPGGKHTHGVGSVEHLQAVALTSPTLPLPARIWLGVRLPPPGQERPRAGRLPRPTAMPQAP